MGEPSSTDDPPLAALLGRMDHIIALLEKLVQAHHAEIAEYQGRLGPTRRWRPSEPPPDTGASQRSDQEQPIGG